MWKTTMKRKEDRVYKWFLVDAKDKVLGKLAVRVAECLMGKDEPGWTPHTLSGKGVIIVNAAKVKVTGRKREQKVYRRYSGYPGGLKQIPFSIQMEKDPTKVIRHAVRLMLPKNRLGRKMLKRLRIYPGEEHPHGAQKPLVMEV